MPVFIPVFMSYHIFSSQSFVPQFIPVTRTILSCKFSETFRPKSNNHKIKDIIHRNSHFYWFSKILGETVNCFGKEYKYGDDTKYYHGISSLMHFPSTIARFSHPTSTTKQITVAQKFATNSGCILQIGYYA
eukprot:298880_1